MFPKRNSRIGGIKISSGEDRITMSRPLPDEVSSRPIRSWESSSACVQKLEDQIEVLKQQNADLQLKLKLKDDLYQQLIEEDSQERFDKRRVYLLKCQVMQLERQLLLQSEAIQSRATVMSELDILLTEIRDKLKSLVCETSGSHVASLSTHASELLGHVESVRCCMQRAVQKSTRGQQGLPLVFRNLFARDDGESTSLLDVCSGSLDHVNLVQVSALESRLASLFQDLTTLLKALRMVSPSRPTEFVNVTIETLHPATQHVDEIMSHVLHQLDDCCYELLLLSSLVPTTPWKRPLKKVSHLELRSKNILEKMPSSIRNKKELVREVDAIVKAVNCTLDLLEMKHSALEHELAFHKSIYDLQISYTDSLFDAVRAGFEDFQQSVASHVCQPLDAIITSFSVLDATSSDDALRQFLTVMRDHSSRLQEVVASLRPQTGSNSQEALSEYGKSFFTQLNKRQRECAAERDRRADEIRMHESQQKETTHQFSNCSLSRRPSAEMKGDVTGDKSRQSAISKSRKPPAKPQTGEQLSTKGKPEIEREGKRPHDQTKTKSTCAYRPPWDSKF